MLGHEPLLYRDLSGRENLEFYAQLYDVADSEARIAELLDTSGMSHRADEPVHDLSRGMVQRLAVCRAVLHSPSLLLLDEPQSGLDPEAEKLVEPLIGHGSGATRVLVTHDIDRGLVEADHVLGLRDGRVILDQPKLGTTEQQVRSIYEGAIGVNAARAIMRKDLLVELRTKESVPAMALFAVTTFVIFHFGLDRDTLEGELAAGVLWVTLLFAAILGINRLFVAEREQGGFDGILMAPVDRTSLLGGKVAALFIYLVALEAIAIPVFGLFFISSGFWEALPKLFAIALPADLGIALVGAMLASIAVHTRARDLLLPLLLLPLTVPVVIAGSSGNQTAAFRARGHDRARQVAGGSGPL